MTLSPATSNRPLLISTILASGMAFIDATALNVALPSIQSDLELNGQELIWIVNSYVLFLSALLLLGGSMGDIYGRKRVFAYGIIVFSISSILCGLAQSAIWLIVFRSLQGVGGALMVPGSLSLITALSPREKRGKLIGIWSMFSALTTILGPLLGGFLSDLGLWRGIFFINVPLAIIALFALRKIPESIGREGQKPDYKGAVLGMLALGLLTLGFTRASESGYEKPEVWISLLTGIILFAFFIRIQRKVNNPLMPLHMFSNSSFAVGNILTFLVYAALGGFLFFLPLNLIQIQGYSPTQAGLVMIPFGLLIAVISSISGRLADSHGERTPLIIGLVLITCGYFSFSIPDAHSGPADFWKTYFPPILLLGTGMGFTVAPVTLLVMNAAQQQLSGIASGINNTVARTSQVLAVAVFGSLALISFQNQMDAQLLENGFTRMEVEQSSSEIMNMGNAEPPKTLSEQKKTAFSQIKTESFIFIFRQTALIACILTAIGTLLTFLSVRRRG